MGKEKMGQKSTKSNYKIEQNDKYSQKESKSEAGPEEKTKRNELTIWIEEISKLRKKIENSNDISSTIQNGFKLFEQLSKEHENFLKKTTKKPDEELLQKCLSPQLKLISEIGSLATKATGVDRHYISMIEAATAIFGWFQYSSISEGKKMIKEHVDSSIYYTTKIGFEKREKFHSDLIAAWKSLLFSFEPYNDYPSGLWNTSGNIQAKTKTEGTDKKETSTTSVVTGSTAMKKIPNIPKEPIKKLDGKKWIIENYKNEEIHLEVKPDQRVYAFNCEGTTIVINGKSNTITIDKCKKTQFVFDSVISQIEIINSNSITGQVKHICPTLSIDGSSGMSFYVSKESKHYFQLISSRTDSVNILLEQGNSNFEEIPIPEQFQTTFKTNKPITVPVEHK